MNLTIVVSASGVQNAAAYANRQLHTPVLPEDLMKVISKEKKIATKIIRKKHVSRRSEVFSIKLITQRKEVENIENKWP